MDSEEERKFENTDALRKETILAERHEKRR